MEPHGESPYGARWRSMGRSTAEESSGTSILLHAHSSPRGVGATLSLCCFVSMQVGSSQGGVAKKWGFLAFSRGKSRVSPVWWGECSGWQSPSTVQWRFHSEWTASRAHKDGCSVLIPSYLDRLGIKVAGLTVRSGPHA